MSWAVARTKAGSEQRAAYNLGNQGFQWFLPRTREIVALRGKLRTKVVPLFPRYIFVEIAGQWREVASTRGIVGIVMEDDTPALARDADIERIRAMEVDGLVVLPPRFIVGQRVRVSSGGYQNVVGVYNGQSSLDRVKVLLSLLGRNVCAEFREGELAPA